MGAMCSGLHSTHAPSPACPARRSISADGLSILQRFTPYSGVLVIGAAGLPMIGYHHVLRPGEQWTQITHDDAISLLKQDLGCIDLYVSALYPDCPQAQHDALVSLVYDVGLRTYERSAVHEALRQGQYATACEELETWVDPSQGKRPDWGRRRAAEATLMRQGPKALLNLFMRWDIEDLSASHDGSCNE